MTTLHQENGDGASRRGLPQPTALRADSCRLYEGVEYTDFWEGVQKRKLDELERAVVSELLPRAGHRLIDIGSGHGRLSDCYLDRFDQAVLFDGSISLLHQARDRTRGRAYYVAGDAVRLPFRPGSFDAALMVRVFHHISDTDACLLGLHRILGTGGQLVFSFSNKRNLLRVFKWLLRQSQHSPFNLEPSHVETTFIHHHPRFVQQRLESAGFAVIQYRGAGILDQVAGRLGRLGEWFPPGVALAPVFGRLQVAPWIFCRCAAGGDRQLSLTGALDDFLQCPSCGSGVTRESRDFRCLSCERIYPVDAEGIVDMRLG